MKNELMCFRASALPDNTRAPEWIMYAPAGKQTVSARLDGQRKVLPVLVDEGTAAALQRDLTARLAEGGPAPFFDFHHEARDAAGYPQEFEWREDGVWVRVQWTPAGAAAITAEVGRKPTIRYFSPRANYDEKAGRITGLLPAEAGNAAGGLVSDPAFEQIRPLTAARAAVPSGDNQHEKTITKMDYTKLKDALVAAGVLTEDECGMENAGELLSGKLSELMAMKQKAVACGKEIEKLTGELTALKETAADGFVRELQCSGKIPPKAQATADMWRRNYLADPDGTRKAAAEIAAAKAITGAALTTQEDGQAANSTAKVLDGDKATARANELMASKAAPNFDEAWTMAMREQGVLSS